MPEGCLHSLAGSSVDGPTAAAGLGDIVVVALLQQPLQHLHG